jgi:hypothetical protein
MSNTAYPIGSVHRSCDIWENLPDEDSSEKAVWIPRLLIGCLWMPVVEMVAACISRLVHQVWRRSRQLRMFA